MRLLRPREADELYAAMGPAREVSGGSAANSMAGAGRRSGFDAGFIGQVANDQLGEIFAHDMTSLGVRFETAPLTGGPPTGRCLILVTPDAQRTMNTSPGASHELTPEALDEALIRSAAVTFLEGYLWGPERPRAAMLRAAEIAHAAGRTVAFTLSESLCIPGRREGVMGMIDAGTVDILFGNEDEVRHLTGCDELDECIAELSLKVADAGGHPRRGGRGRDRAWRASRGPGGACRQGRRHDRRRRPVRRWLPRRALPRGAAPALPRRRIARRGRGHFAFRRAARSRSARAGAPVKNIARLAVYCGSASGSQPVFAEAARATARAMVDAGVDLVYGGGRLGLMGLIADRMLELGGRVYGVIPQALVDIEVAHPSLTELDIVANMHERKARMTDLADAFLALPGGIGTLDELFEAWSWNALGYHAKPFCLLNVEGLLGRADRIHRPCDTERLPVPATARPIARRTDPRRGLEIAGRSRGRRYARHGLVGRGEPLRC